MSMSGDLLLSIDIGSSSCKVGLFDFNGRCLATAKSQVLAKSTENGTGAREYDPYNWISAAKKSIRSLSISIGNLYDRVACIGLSGQIGTHIVTTNSMEPIYPAISWQDGRAWEQANELALQYPGFSLDAFIGMHLPPGTAWPIPRLLWIKANEPHLLKNTKWIQPKDFLCSFLTGELVTDYLSLRGLMNPSTHEIHSEVNNTILDLPDLPAMLPEAREAWDVAGYLRKSVATSLKLKAGTPVVVGAGDFHCAVLGSGIMETGTGFNVSGTSDHIGLLVEKENTYAKSEVLGRYPSLLPGKDILYGATSSSGGMLEWFVTNLGTKRKIESFSQYLDRTLKGQTRSGGILCLPYLNGERAPIWNSDARAVFAGIGAGHTKSEMLLSIMEGVAFSLCQNNEILKSIATPCTRFQTSGASAQSCVWNKIKANVLKSRIVILESHEISCLGAAMLAAVGAGIFKDTKEASSAMTRETSIIDPDPKTYDYYEELFSCYQQEYAANIDIFHSLAMIRKR